METASADNHEAFGHFLVVEGVDLTHGHSAHVFQGVEVHDGAICYDAGDFVDDYRVDPDLDKDRSFLFVVGIDDSHVTSLGLPPVEIRDCAVHPASAGVAGWCRRTVRECSATDGTDFQRDGEELVLDFT
jgi:poly-gamma-glutamate synthesis protein (capsule biosynthesis protein)